MKYIASCSNGKDSLAMVLTLLEKNAPLDHVVFIDTGKEFKSIYKVWEKLSLILGKAGIEHSKITPDKTFDYYFSEHEVHCQNGNTKNGYSWCGGRTRWMTTFKQLLLSKFYKQTYPDDTIVEYVGIASDELDRVKFERLNTVKIYPLILWQMSENDCLIKCYKKGFNWTEDNGVDLYDVLDRVSCFCCGNKNLTELKAIHDHLPEYWQKLRDMQSLTPIPFKGDKTVFDLEKMFQ